MKVNYERIEKKKNQKYTDLDFEFWYKGKGFVSG